MNALKARITEDLKQIVGLANVLVDVEDLYVYSYELFFRKLQYSRLDVVVRVASDEQARKVLELAEGEGFTLIRRSSGKAEVSGSAGSLKVLLDDVVPPKLEAGGVDEGVKEQIANYTREIFRAGHGTFRNLALGLKTLFLKAPASKCLQCTVCSGYCTVTPSFNGVETWSSKGRALLIPGFFAGELKPSKKLIDVIYTCSLCGLCFADCFEDTEVRKTILDARRRLAEQGQAPNLFTLTAKNIVKTGDVAATPTAKRLAWMRDLKVKSKESAEVLYWVGCVVATRTPHTARAVVKVLNEADVNFTLLGEKEGCCGYVLLASGLWKEAKNAALNVVKRVKETRAKVLVTSCAGCYYTFSKLYPEFLNLEIPLEVMHVSQFTYDLLKDGQLELGELGLKVTYHDPCSLGRHGKVFDEPRKVLRAIPKLRLVEMPLNRRRARCCGAGGGLWSFNYQVSLNSAYTRLANDVIPLEVSILTTACPTCHVNLKHASVKKAMGIKIYDIVELVANSLIKSQTSTYQGKVYNWSFRIH
jgi:Fe-S oxidoreductase